jgi:hypothetical protein
MRAVRPLPARAGLSLRDESDSTYNETTNKSGAESKGENGLGAIARPTARTRPVRNPSAGQVAQTSSSS